MSTDTSFLTDEQNLIVYSESPCLVINAYAGTGKTTVLKHYAIQRPLQRWLYLAYNRAIREEANQKFPKHVTCLTSHQLAFRNIGYRYKHKLQNQLSITDIADALNTSDWFRAGLVREALSLFLHGKSTLLSEGMFKSISRKIGERKSLLKACNVLWTAMQDESHKLAMTHDGYLKLYQLTLPDLSTSFDGILFDEAQDVNGVTRHIILNQSIPWIMVGDKHQQIYRFRGAENAMNDQSIKHVETLNLTHSFRFGSEVAKLANEFLSIKGDKIQLKGDDRSDEVKVFKKKVPSPKSHHVVLHRTVAGVIMTALNSKKCYWVGGINSYRLSDIEDLFWFSRKRADLVKNKKNIKPYKNYEDYQTVARESNDSEMIQTINIINKHDDLPAELLSLRARAVDDEKDADVTVSTAHRCKGLEWETVVIYNDFPDLLNHEKQRSPHYYEDELNLLYVAVTRSMRYLFISHEVHCLTVDSDSRDRLKKLV